MTPADKRKNRTQTTRYTPLYKALRELIKLERHSRSFTHDSVHARRAAQHRDEQIQMVTRLIVEAFGESCLKGETRHESSS